MRKARKEKLLILAIVCSFVMVSLTFGPGPAISENSFLISGDGFNNQKIVLGVTSDDFENNYYARGTYNYNQDDQNLTIRISGSHKTLDDAPIAGIEITFNTTTQYGVYTTDSAISVSLFFKKDIPANTYERHYTLDSDGVVEIKSYDPIGGLIEGTFSGTFVKMKYNKETNVLEESDTSIKVTNGKFSVVHTPDYHWDAPQSTGAEPDDFKEKKKKGKKI
jgi:hypothetical protein